MLYGYGARLHYNACNCGLCVVSRYFWFLWNTRCSFLNIKRYIYICTSQEKPQPQAPNFDLFASSLPRQIRKPTHGPWDKSKFQFTGISRECGNIRYWDYIRIVCPRPLLSPQYLPYSNIVGAFHFSIVPIFTYSLLTASKSKPGRATFEERALLLCSLLLGTARLLSGG